MFGKKKKKNKEGQDVISKISSGEILVRVYKDFGSNTPHLKAEYKAIERRDIYNNLISINKEFLHNEDTDFAIDEVYDKMNITLELKNLTKEEKIKLIDERIKKQDELLKALDKYVELNSVYNYLDEELKRKDLATLREFIKYHDDSGSYFTIEKGLRVYSFESVDGFLVPIWHGIVRHTQYPDHTRKRKISIQEDIIMKKELQQYNRDKIVGNILTWGLIFNIILFGILVFSGYKVWDKHNSMESQAYDSAIKCAEYTSRVNEEITKAISANVLQVKPPKEEEEIKGKVTDLIPPNIIN